MDKKIIIAIIIGLAIIALEWYTYVFSGFYGKNVRNLVISIILTVGIVIAVALEIKSKKTEKTL
jgi:hypothetical protein